MRLTVIEAHSNGGSVAVLKGVDENDQVWRFGADWRCARDIAEALEDGQDVDVEVEDWQVLGGPTPLQSHDDREVIITRERGGQVPP